MMISSSLEGLFSTHPPIEARIEALTSYAGGRETISRKAAVRMATPGLPAEPMEPASPWGRRAELPGRMPPALPGAPPGAMPGAMPAFGRRRSFLAGAMLHKPQEY